MEVLKRLQEEIDKVENIEKIQNIFYKYANKLMNNYYLKIGDLEIELCEIEFYYYDEDKKHADCYVHLSELQQEIGKLYVHNNSNVYNRVGIDLTFGNGKYYGGILIRGIKDKKTNKFIAGPAKVRQYFEEKLCSNINKDNFDNKETQQCLNKFSIEIKENKQNNNILISIREGLSETFKKFTFLLYRYIREDYLFASPSKNFNNKLKNISNLSQIKAISHLCKIYQNDLDSDTKKRLEDIKQNKDLLKNIQTFKDNLS